MAEMDDYGRHEVLHRTSFLHRAVSAELCDHRQVQAHPEWKALADAAADQLWTLYQMIGEVHLADGAPEMLGAD